MDSDNPVSRDEFIARCRAHIEALRAQLVELETGRLVLRSGPKPDQMQDVSRERSVEIKRDIALLDQATKIAANLPGRRP